MRTSPRFRAVLLLFAATIFLSALLLFWIQLVMAKMLLPRLGGTPAVWTTCMLFFQVLLLLGYAYVLVVTKWISVPAQLFLQLALLGGSTLNPQPRGEVDGCSEPTSPVMERVGQITTDRAGQPSRLA